MSEKQNDDLNTGGENRRDFIKTVTATAAVVGGLGISELVASESTAVPVDADDLHICRGLNTKTSATGELPGTCDATNIPQADLHGCAGGNTCKGLGGCGTGDYATQYWVSENSCGRKGDTWNGTGGCGVPIGSSNTGFICTQLNNAVPTPTDNPNNQPAALVGVPVWAIARARFEAKMVKNHQGFGVPKPPSCGQYNANTFKPGDTYVRGSLPEPHPNPIPTKKSPP